MSLAVINGAEASMHNQFITTNAKPDAAWLRARWPDPSCVLRKLCFRPNMSAVDLCCGDGHFTAAMAQMLNGSVYGLDIDPEILAQAQAKSCNRVVWIEADARDVPHKLSEPVDIVFIANTFHDVPEKTDLAKAVRQVLKPDGLFIVMNWHAAAPNERPLPGPPLGPRPQHRMTPIEVAQEVEPAGYDLIEVAALPPHHYGAIFQKQA